MKKNTIPALLLIFMLLMTGCNSSSDTVSVSDRIGDDVTAVNIIYTDCDGATEWTVEGSDMDSLKTWINGLTYKLKKFEDGDIPSDAEVYSFFLTEKECPEFSYYICGPDSCYLLIEGNWYSVSNPSAPPVTAPEPKAAGDNT